MPLWIGYLLISAAAAQVVNIIGPSLATDAFWSVVNGFLWLLSYVAFWLYYFGAMLFDLALQYTVVQNPIDLTYAGVVIGWTIIRDFANLTFIFVLIYIGVMTMLEAGGFGMKKMLTRLIIVALIINFSFFITRFVIDISNFVAFQIYNSLDVPPPSGVLQDHVGASMSLHQALGFEGLYQRLGEENLTKEQSAIIYVVRTILYLVGFWVFLQMGLLFVARVVAFIFLIVVSPAAFICSVLPGTEKYYKEWRETLIGQALVAPIFLFFFLVIIKIATAPNLINTLQGNQSMGAAAPIFLFTLIIFMLLRALKITKGFSGTIGATATSWGNLAAGVLAGGAVGFAARQTVGRAALRLSQSESLRNTASTAGAKGFIARQTLMRSENASKKTMDIRNTKTASKLGLGQGTKSTYASYRDNVEKYYKGNIDRVGKTRIINVDFDADTQKQFIEREEMKLAGMRPESNEHTALTKRIAQLKADTNFVASEISAARGKERATNLANVYRAGSAPAPAGRIVTPAMRTRVMKEHADILTELKTKLTKAVAETPPNEGVVKSLQAQVRDQEKKIDTLSGLSNEDFAKEMGVRGYAAWRFMGWATPQYNAARAALRDQGKTKEDKALDVLKEALAESAPATPAPAAAPATPPAADAGAAH